MAPAYVAVAAVVIVVAVASAFAYVAVVDDAVVALFAAESSVALHFAASADSGLDQ